MSGKPSEPEYTLVELSPLRQAIGARTQTSFRDIPQFSASRQVVCGGIGEARATLRVAGADPLPSFNDFLLKLVGLTLREFPTFNAWLDEEGLKLLQPINVGFACDTEEGLLLPTLFDADSKPLAQIAQETRALIEQARVGRLRASLQRGAGFTISNIGPTGVDFFHGILSPPQTALLALGAVAQRPMVIMGEVVGAPTMYLTLTMDHRVHDGRHGAAFLGELAQKLGDTNLLTRL